MYQHNPVQFLLGFSENVSQNFKKGPVAFLSIGYHQSQEQQGYSRVISMSDGLWQNAVHEESLNIKYAPAVFPVAELNGDQLHSEVRSIGDSRQPAIRPKYQIDISLT